MAIKLHASFAVHPGAWLFTEVVAASGLSMTEEAERLQVGQQALSDVLRSQVKLPVYMANRFEHAFSLRSDTLLQMQEKYDLELARGTKAISSESNSEEKMYK